LAAGCARGLEQLCIDSGLRFESPALTLVWWPLTPPAWWTPCTTNTLRVDTWICLWICHRYVRTEVLSRLRSRRVAGRWGSGARQRCGPFPPSISPPPISPLDVGWLAAWAGQAISGQADQQWCGSMMASGKRGRVAEWGAYAHDLAAEQGGMGRRLGDGGARAIMSALPLLSGSGVWDNHFFTLFPVCSLQKFPFLFVPSFG